MKGKVRAADYLILDPVSGTYREDPEQIVRDDVEKHYWLHVGRTILKDWRLYVMLIPMLLIFLFWRYFPMYELLGCFKVPDEVKPVAEQYFSGFSYFKSLLVGSDATEFWRALRNTFLLSFYGLLFGFPMPIILALFFNEIKSNILRSSFQVMTYLPKFMSTVVMTTLVTMLVKQGSEITGEMGILSRALVNMGLITKEVGMQGLLNNAGYFRGIYQISGIWETAGYDSIVFFAAIIAISPTSYEAAQIDGANKMQQIWHVTLPGIRSTIVVLLILNVGQMMNISFDRPYILGNTLVQDYCDVLSTFVYRTGITNAKFDRATAIGLFNSIVSFTMLMVVNFISKRVSETSLF